MTHEGTGLVLATEQGFSALWLAEASFCNGIKFSPSNSFPLLPFLHSGLASAFPGQDFSLVVSWI